jgi:Tol biopolymer transport system component
MYRMRFVSSVAAAAALTLAAAACTSTARVSVAGDEAEGNGASVAPEAGATGRFVAFVSGASNLVPGDTNGVADVFVRDTVGGTTTRVSVRDDEGQANGPSQSPYVSDDGRHVLFTSSATNLRTNDTNNATDVYIRDTVSGSTVLVSKTGTGTPASAASHGWGLTPDGAFAVWSTGPNDIVPTDAMFLYQVAQGYSSWRLATPEPCPEFYEPGTLGAAAFSGDGRTLVFQSFCRFADRGRMYVVVYDRDAETYTVIRDHRFDNGISNTLPRPSVSSDGTVVAWSEASVGHGSVSNELLVWEAPGPAQTVNDHEAGDVALSPDGRYLAYVGNSDSFAPEVRVLDRTTNQTVVASTNVNGAPSTGREPTFTHDRSHVVFSSAAGDLVPNDTNGASDVFARPLSSLFSDGGGATRRVSG